MISTDLKVGCKVTIQITQHAAREKQNGSVVAKKYQSEIYDIRDDGILVMPIPIIQTKLVNLPANIRYDFMFSTDKGFMMAHGMVVRRYRKNNFFLMDITLTSGLEKFQRREYFRLDCLIDSICIALGGDDFDPMQIKDINEYLLNDIDAGYSVAHGTILNISGGGALFTTDYNFIDTTFILLRIVLHENEDKPQDSMDIIGRILEKKKNPDTGKYSYRIMFVFRNPRLRERIVQYVFEQQRRLRRKEQGI